jgi:hypothetical protein
MKIKINEDEIVELSVVIVNKFVEEGLVKDCTDTDDETEFDFQDCIREVLKERYGISDKLMKLLIYGVDNFADYLLYLDPIIEDVLDGDEEPLTQKSIDDLMKVIRAKVEFHQGLIKEEEYKSRIELAYD